MNPSQNRNEPRSPQRFPTHRIQGGNWNRHGFRRASELFDEVEYRSSIADFILEQGLPRDGEFN
jgi:hypothetical protein